MANKRGSTSITKVCLFCSGEFVVPRCRSEAKYCSHSCACQGRRGMPKNFSSEALARLGRPKRSKDVERKCPTCGVSMILPEWNPQIYCSKPCYGKAKRGKKHPLNQQVEITCAVCGTKFSRAPSFAKRVRCCSRACGAKLMSQSAYREPRTMTDAECAWLAGVFDGEGSVVARKRQQNGDCRNIAISIVNTSKPLMEQVLAFTETGWIQGRQPKNPDHLYQWTWTIHGATAIELLRRMRPWLTARAERADAAIEGRPFPRLPRWEKVYGHLPDPVAVTASGE